MESSFTQGAIPSFVSYWREDFRRLKPVLQGALASSAGRYSIAGMSVSVQFGSKSLRENVSPALRHLDGTETTETSLTIFLHDLASAPCAAEIFGNHFPSGGDADIWLVDGPHETFIVQRQGGVISAVDWNSNVAYWLVRDAASIPYLERAAPLKLLLSHWLGRNGKYIVHSAAVGNENGGVLIIGHGGAGKSTTALSCMVADLEYAADDHCLLSLEPTPTAHSIYGTAKLAAANLNQFPALVPAAMMDGRPAEEKVVFFLGELPCIRLRRSFPIHAILLANITGLPKTTLRKVSRAEGFKALAPSCALHFPAQRTQALQCFNSLVRQLPTYVLELGTEIHAIPNTIRGLLNHLSK